MTDRDRDAGLAVEHVGLPSPTGAPSNGWGGHPCRGRYVRPAAGAPRVACIATHYNLDFSEHYLGPLLARRGFGFLGWNTRFCGAEPYLLVDHAVAEIGAGVRWLREVAGAEVVVLLGNSGGGSLMAAYQSLATGGHIEPVPGTRLADGLDDLAPADLYVSVAAHPGRAELMVTSMDPSVLDEADPTARDRSLDMYDEANGPPYSAEFVARYRAAQLERNRRITAWARSEWDRLKAAGTRDRVFEIPRLWADLRYLDGSIDASNRRTPACWMGDPRRANQGPSAPGQISTLRTWFSMSSIETSQCRAELHLPNITVPALVVSGDADAGIYPSDTQGIFDTVASADKHMELLPGDHYFTAPDGAREGLADLISAWLKQRT